MPERWLGYIIAEKIGNPAKAQLRFTGGCNPAEFMEKIRVIQDAVGPYDPDEEYDE